MILNIRPGYERPTFDIFEPLQAIGAIIRAIFTAFRKVGGALRGKSITFPRSHQRHGPPPRNPSPCTRIPINTLPLQPTLLRWTWHYRFPLTRRLGNQPHPRSHTGGQNQRRNRVARRFSASVVVFRDAI